MALTSAREKRLWLQAAAVQLLIYASLAYVRTPTTWLRERNLLRLTVGLLFLVAVAWIVWQVSRRRPGVMELVVLAVFGAVYVYVLQGMRMVEERVHFLEYGLVGGLVYAALWERRINLIRAGSGPLVLTRFPAAAAILITGLLGWGDEGIQYVLPERYYELRDVGMNFAAGVLVVLAMAAMRWARGGASEKGEGPPLSTPASQKGDSPPLSTPASQKGDSPPLSTPASEKGEGPPLSTPPRGGSSGGRSVRLEEEGEG